MDHGGNRRHSCTGWWHHGAIRAAPYFEGLTLYEQVLADNNSQNRQNYTLTRERWQSLGKPVAIAGSVAFVVGSLATGFGLNWALAKPAAQE